MAFADRTVSFQGVQGQLESTLSAHTGTLEVGLIARKQNYGVTLELHRGVGVLVSVQLELDILIPRIGLRHLIERDLPRLLRAGPKRASELYFALLDGLELPPSGLPAFERWLESLTEVHDPPRLAHVERSYFLPAWVQLGDLERAPRSQRGQTYLALATQYWRERFASSPLGFEQTLEDVRRIETHPVILEGLRQALSLPLPDPQLLRPAQREPVHLSAEPRLDTDTQFTRFVRRAGNLWAVADHPDFPVLHFPRRTLEGKVIYFRMQLLPDGVVFAYHQKSPPAWFAYRTQRGHVFVIPFQDRSRRTYVKPDEFIDTLLSYHTRLLAKPPLPDLALYPVGERLLSELETALRSAL